jgi:hypothetical protein
MKTFTNNFNQRSYLSDKYSFCFSCLWHIHQAAMTKWLSCLARTTKVLWSNFVIIRHGMTLDKSLTTVCIGSPERCILITCDIHQSLWLVSVYGEFKWSIGGTLRQVSLLSRATASNSCRKNIGLSKSSLDSTLYRRVAERRGVFFLLFIFIW